MERLWAQWWREFHAEYIVAYIELPPNTIQLETWDFLLRCDLPFEICFEYERQFTHKMYTAQNQFDNAFCNALEAR